MQAVSTDENVYKIRSLEPLPIRTDKYTQIDTKLVEFIKEFNLDMGDYYDQFFD